MKVFLSWSGELSQKIASLLKDWLPCCIQSLETFFSSEDIEKGENFDSRLTSELQETYFGIICLTNENVRAPWLHFEAGAISKTGKSRVAPLLINTSISEIKGPLSRFQATFLNRDSMLDLVKTINKNIPQPLQEIILVRSFDAQWPSFIEDVNEAIKNTTVKSEKKTDQQEIFEEILLNTRNQYNQYIKLREDIQSMLAYSVALQLHDLSSYNLSSNKKNINKSFNELLENYIHKPSLNEIVDICKTVITQKYGLIEKADSTSSLMIDNINSAKKAIENKNK